LRLPEKNEQKTGGHVSISGFAGTQKKQSGMWDRLPRQAAARHRRADEVRLPCCA
jgi:hypothetical protein